MRLLDVPRRVLWSWRYFRDPHAFFVRGKNEFGDPFEVPGLDGEFVCTCEAEGAREVFGGDPESFDVAPVSKALLGPVVGLQSLLLIDGAKHRRERKLLAPPFHGSRMRAYGSAMYSAALRACDRWVIGNTAALQDTTQAISLDVIVETVFGIRDPGRRKSVSAKVSEVTGAFAPPLMFFPVLRKSLAGRGPWARFVRSKRQLDDLLRAEIGARRRAVADDHEDILSLMLGARYEDGGAMSDDEVIDELLTMLMAGHETTASGLAWAVYHLLRHPDQLDRLRDELDALRPDTPAEAYAKLAFLGAVCDETLRLHPIVPDVVRRAVRPLTLRGRPVRPGQLISVAITMIHRDPELYFDPTSFRAERFLGRKYRAYEYMPFGGGHRRCLGGAFANFEMRVVLAAIVKNYRLRLAHDRELRPVRRNVTMGPEDGVPIVFEGRR